MAPLSLCCRWLLVFTMVCVSLGACWAGRQVGVRSSSGALQAAGTITQRHITQLQGFVHQDHSTGAFKFSGNSPDDGAILVGPAPAHGSLSAPQEHISGFGQLRIHTSHDFPDIVQLGAAGFLEGYLTAELIFDHWYNMMAWLNSQTNDSFKLGDWLLEQDKWLMTQLEAHKNSSDSYWRAMALIMAQFDGLVAGYNARLADMGPQARINRLSRWDFLVMNAYGDIEDLLVMLFQKRPFAAAEWQSLGPGKVRARLSSRGHCSALVRVTGDLSDILMGHVSWWTYSSMLRLYKHYKFGLADPAIHSTASSFASYPGLLSSMDDWYILNSNMVVMETTNDIYNVELYRQSTPNAALSWQRVLIANMLASNGEEWSELASQYNSGTYNNQYMVVDLKRFHPGQELQPGLLTVVEIVPGTHVWADVTKELVRGYWPSYNVPYFPDIYNMTGYSQTAQQLATWGEQWHEVLEGLSYQLAPRAKIFRRDAGMVADVESLKVLLRSNGWPEDAYSGSSPWGALCARGDLDPAEPNINGCYDGKVANYRMAMAMTSEAISGPPSGPNLKEFSWADWPNVFHRGMPDVLQTAWETQKP